jgi:cupin 2 domain-containing protein
VTLPRDPAANLFAPAPADLPEEAVAVLAEGSGARIERIVSRGHASPAGFWYDQDRPEFVALLQGEAVLDFADGPPLRLRAGDCLTIPAHRRHRVAWTSTGPDCVWLAVHFAP